MESLGTPFVAGSFDFFASSAPPCDTSQEMHGFEGYTGSYAQSCLRNNDANRTRTRTQKLQPTFQVSGARPHTASLAFALVKRRC